MRAALPLLAVLLLGVWVISVAGATGCGPGINWTLVLVAVALLGLRAAVS